MNIRPASTLFLLLSFLFFTACAVEDGDEEEAREKEEDAARVEELSTELEIISVTDQASLKADIAFSEDAVHLADNKIVVLVRLPEFLSYVPESARIEGADGTIPAEEEACDTGETYLRFEIESRDLMTPDDDLTDRASLVLLVRGEQPGGALTAARAQYNEVAGSCAESIVPDATASLDIISAF